MKILLLLSLFFSSELLGYDPNNNRLFDRAEKLCKENPGENLAVILTKTTIPAEDRARTGTRIRRKERVYYKYRTQKVEKLNLVSNTHFIGKYFRILDKDTDNAIELSCKNLRASNVYFHLNYIHELFLDKMIPYFPKAVKERME